MSTDSVAQELVGRTIKEIFKHAGEVSDLHACLTSPRGDYFRLRVLQAVEVPGGEAVIEQVRDESGVQECRRHLHKLLRFGLISVKEIDGEKQYSRTDLGERAINTVRELERSIGRSDVRAIDSAALGPNSIRFFLRIYGDKAAVNWVHGEIQLTPAEVGRLSLFLPRIIEGVCAVDKLSEAGLVVYRDDGYIYMSSVQARSFYRYLQELYEIVRANSRHHGRRSNQQ